MGAALNMASEKNAYVLADRGTYLSYKADLSLVIACEGDPSLVNQYGIIAVNPEKHPGIKFGPAMQYIDWLCSDEGQAAVGSYVVEGEMLFQPNCKGVQK
jgi:tungstate transport system substrate-binding protein